MQINGKGAFGVPPGELTVDNPDGVTKVYGDNDQRHSLYDARHVSNYGGSAFGYGAFRGEQDDYPAMPWDNGNDCCGSTTGTTSKKPLGRQR